MCFILTSYFMKTFQELDEDFEVSMNVYGLRTGSKVNCNEMQDAVGILITEQKVLLFFIGG